MEPAILAIASVLLVSLVSFIGIFFISMSQKRLKSILMELIAFAIGGMLGGVFLHLLPETGEELGFTTTTSIIVLAGFLFSLLVEKFIHWHHCHKEKCDEHDIKSFAFVNLLGDGVHNFIDGVLIAASYLAGIHVGIATTLAVILHEIPQEIGDFAVLVHAGFSRAKALFANFASALTALLGTLLTLFVGVRLENFTPYLLPFAAGNFLYLAGVDLIPELHKEHRTSRMLAQLGAIFGGILVMALLLLVE